MAECVLSSARSRMKCSSATLLLGLVTSRWLSSPESKQASSAARRAELKKVEPKGDDERGLDAPELGPVELDLPRGHPSEARREVVRDADVLWVELEVLEGDMNREEGR